MRKFGQIQASYWTDPDVRPLDLSAKAIGAYLLTCEHTNIIGCFRLPKVYVSEDLDIGIETVSEGFQNLSGIGFLRYCEGTQWVLLPKFLRWNELANPNTAKGARKQFEAVPEKISVYGELCESILRYGRHLEGDFRNRLETLCEQYRNIEIEREIDIDPDISPSKGGIATSSRTLAVGGGR